jgi:hypothetical protein
VYSNYTQFDWLRNKTRRGKQQIDIFVPSVKLAIEYDGAQHFRPVRFGGISIELARENFKKQKRSDKLKDKKIKDHPEDVAFFIRIRYDEHLDETSIRDRLVEAGALIDND